MKAERDKVMKQKKQYEKPHAEYMSFRIEENLMATYSLEDPYSKTETGVGEPDWLEDEYSDSSSYRWNQ